MNQFEFKMPDGCVVTVRLPDDRLTIERLTIEGLQKSLRQEVAGSARMGDLLDKRSAEIYKLCTWISNRDDFADLPNEIRDIVNRNLDIPF